MRNEYPRVGFVRDSFIVLNGIWDFAFDDQNVGKKEKWYQNFVKMPLKIQVPFAFQSQLSGIQDSSPHDRIWYHRSFCAPDLSKHERLILHFDGVDYYCEVYLNGSQIFSHYGSATRFSMDITDSLQKENDLVLYVFDSTKDINFPRGKQDWEVQSHDIWYTRTSGIYKTVWMEKVHEVHLKQAFMTPLYEEEALQVIFSCSDQAEIRTVISYRDEWKQEYVTYIEKNNQQAIFSLKGQTEGRKWDIGQPNLFDVIFRVYQQGKLTDEVKSYFGFRKIETRGQKVYLNDHPIYQKLLLNQSYFPDGILTPSSALKLKEDILLMKEYGFNGCRVHQKVEEEYLYYYADHEGFLIWCESPSTYQYSLNNPRQMLNEWISIVKQYYNFPSIIVWTPLNESWGVEGIAQKEQIQAHALSLYYTIKSLDNTRLVIGNDGWEHTKTDLLTIHNYHHGVSATDEKFVVYKHTLHDRASMLQDGTGTKRQISLNNYNDVDQLPILLSEFAGISFKNNPIKDSWGYTLCHDDEDYLNNLQRIFTVLDESNCIEGFCLTQFSDVEQETNGIVTYDRKHKVHPEKIRRIIEKVKEQYGKEIV